MVVRPGVKLVSLFTRARNVIRSLMRLPQCLFAATLIVPRKPLYNGPVMFAEEIIQRRLFVAFAPVSVQSLLVANAGAAK